MGTRTDWLGFKWLMLGDFCEVIRHQDGGWVYKRTRRGEPAGGGLLNNSQLEDYVAFEVLQAPVASASKEVGTMENKYKVGDRVRIISGEWGQAGLTGHIMEIEGSDYVTHETPYKVRSFWYRASDLVLIADADMIEYARHENPVASADAAGGAGDLLPAPDLSTERLLRLGLEKTDEVFALQARVKELAAALEPFSALWGEWYTYCMSGDSKYETILDWLAGEKSYDQLARWFRVVEAAQQRGDGAGAGVGFANGSGASCRCPWKGDV